VESDQELSIPGFSRALLYDEVSSTMDVARSFAELGKPAVCLARRQLAGRGRQGRTWGSSGGGFMGTFVFPTFLQAQALSGYSLAVGVAICEALEQFGVAAKLKWPNDIVVMRQMTLLKLGGVLIEVVERGVHRCVAVGVGINLVSTPEGVDTAGSLRALFGVSPALIDVAKSLGERLLISHSLFEGMGGFKAFRGDWLTRSVFPLGGARLSVDLGHELISGVFYGIDDNGALLLEVSGVATTVHAGHLTGWSMLR